LCPSGDPDRFRRIARLVSVLRQRLTYANVMATVAVFLALGGGAYALKLGRNSVRSKQIAPDAAKGVDVDEASLAKVPDADKLDGLDSTVLATKGQLGAVQTQLDSTADELLVGRASPTAVPAQVFFSVPSMNLRVETDGDADQDNNIVVNDTDSVNDLGQLTGGGPGAIIDAALITAPGDFAGSPSTASNQQLDALIRFGTGPQLLIHCLFADVAGDTCYGIRMG
jgi:hypothetical protein